MLEPGRGGQALGEAGGANNLRNTRGALQVGLGIMASHSSSQPPPLPSSPTSYKMVPGEGMPLTQDPQRKGDLYIYFDIFFPRSLSPQVKTLLKSILQA